MEHSKVQAIRNYLSQEFPGVEPAEKDDFDLGARRFKLPTSGASLLLKVSDEFAADTTPTEIENRLAEWEVAAWMREQGEHTYIFVGSNGPQVKARG